MTPTPDIGRITIPDALDHIDAGLWLAKEPKKKR
jgi:hypothetical protein